MRVRPLTSDERAEREKEKEERARLAAVETARTATQKKREEGEGARQPLALGQPPPRETVAPSVA